MSTGKSFLHFIRFWCGIDKPHSQTTDAERECLFRHAQLRKRLVEIGVFEGLTTAVIANAMSPSGEFYAIDPFFKGRIGICWGKLIAKKYLKYEGLAPRVSLVECLSTEAVNKLIGSFDFVFIDGDHSLEGIKQDYSDWAGRIDRGGILALHDTSVPKHNINVEKLGSFKFFQEVIRFDDNFEHLETVDSLNILRRRNS